MKQHLSHYSVWIIACLLLGVNLHAQEVKPVIVHVEKAGTLTSLIDPAMKYQITNLTVTGELNGTDIRYIRLTAGSADTATFKGTVWSTYDSFVSESRSGIDIEATKKRTKQEAERRAARFLRGDTIEGKLSFLDLSGATIVSGGEEYADYNKGFSNKEITTSDGALGYYMFGYCESLTSIVLPNNIKELPNYTFYYCRRLTSVTLPKSLKTINGEVFVGCSSLASITFPDSLETIGSSAFDNCKGLTSFVLPTSITSIGSYAFRGCTGLTSLVLPNSITKIGEYAFKGCTGLTSITMPDETLGFNESYTPYFILFSECKGIKEIHVYPTNPKYTSVNGILFSKDGKTLIAYPMGRSGEYTIPEGVTSIGANAFRGCSGLTSVSLPENISVIPEYAFSGCSSLSAITIPERVTTISNDAFNSCKSLTSIHIPESVTQIETRAFVRCEKLTSVTLPNAAIVAGNTFSGCALLKEFVVSSDNPLYCTVDGVLLSKDKKTLLAYPDGKSKSYMIPDGVTTIGAHAFADCKELTSVTLPKSVTTIGEYAFIRCAGLTSIHFPDSVTSIGNLAFYGCIGLTSVTLPKNITTIGTKAFLECTGLTSLTLPKGLTTFGEKVIYGCKNLKAIYCKSFEPPLVVNSPLYSSEYDKVFEDDPNTSYKKSCVLYVPNRAAKAYSLANEWSSFVHISGE